MNLKKIALVGATALCGTSLFATDYTWSGNSSGAWNDPANWLVGGETATSYPGQSAEDDTVTFPKGDFTVMGSGDTVFKVQKITHTAGDSAESKSAVTFKDINLYWTAAPVIANNLRITLNNVKYGCQKSNDGRIYFSKKTNVDLVFVGNVTSKGTGNDSSFYSITDTTSFTVTGGGAASISFYGWPTAIAQYTIDGSVWNPRDQKPNTGHYVFKNGGRMEQSDSWTMKGTQVNDIVLRSDELESAGGVARIAGTGNMSMTANEASTFNFDLKDAPFGNYIIMQHTPSKGWNANKFLVPDSAAANLGYTVNLLNADGKKAHFELEQKFVKTSTTGPVSNSWVRLVVESASFVDNAWKVPPSVVPDTRYFDDDPPVVTLGEPLAGEVVASTNGVAVTAAEIAAFGLGEHSVDFTVEAKPNAWSGLQTNIVVRVVKHENAWVEPPSVTKTRWWGHSDETNDVARTLGEALYGDVTCNYTDEQLRNLDAGRYTVRFEVPETDAVAGLVTNINLFVQGDDTNEVVYTWKSAVTDGKWCDPANWESEGGLLGFPSNALVKAVIPTGVRTIDLEGCTIPLKATSDPGMTVKGQGQTIRNGGISVGRLWADGSSFQTYEDMTIDLNSSGLTSYYSFQGDARAVLRGNVSVLRGYLNGRADNADLTICDGATYVAGSFIFGSDGKKAPATRGTLSITNASLEVGRNISFGTENRDDHTPPVLQLFDGNIVCANEYKKGGVLQYGYFTMTSPATNELVLTAANKAVPRIEVNYAALSNMTFVVKAAEGPGNYPLVRATTSLTFNGMNELTGCSLDVSPLGKGWSGTLELSEDGKTLSAKLSSHGLIFFVQ